MSEISKLMEELKVLDSDTWNKLFTKEYYGLSIELMTDPNITPCYPEKWSGKSLVEALLTAYVQALKAIA